MKAKTDAAHTTIAFLLIDISHKMLCSVADFVLTSFSFCNIQNIASTSVQWKLWSVVYKITEKFSWPNELLSMNTVFTLHGNLMSVGLKGCENVMKDYWLAYD